MRTILDFRSAHQYFTCAGYGLSVTVAAPGRDSREPECNVTRHFSG